VAGRKKFIAAFTGVALLIGLIGGWQWYRDVASPGQLQGSDQVPVGHGAAASTERRTALGTAGRSKASVQVDQTLVKRFDGKAYTIVRTGLYRKPGDAKAQILALKPRSDAGDALASYEIHLAVLDCRQLLGGNPEEDWQRLKDAGMHPDPAFMAGIERRLGECGALSQDLALFDAPWLARAAEQGSVEAGMLYYISPESVLGEYSEWLAHPERVQEWRENALRYLQAGASDGYLDALAALGRAYERGIVVDPDPVAAYAYTLAAGQSEPTYLSEVMIGDMRDALSPQQQAQAKARAKVIHRDCCEP